MVHRPGARVEVAAGQAGHVHQGVVATLGRGAGVADGDLALPGFCVDHGGAVRRAEVVDHGLDGGSAGGFELATDDHHPG